MRRYIEDSGLPFNILVDDARDTVRAYGVWHPVGFDAWNIARPAVFLIDRRGIIRYSFVASWQFEFPTHEDLLAQIRRLSD